MSIEEVVFALGLGAVCVVWQLLPMFVMSQLVESTDGD
jgi:hypothetical protein